MPTTPQALRVCSWPINCLLAVRLVRHSRRANKVVLRINSHIDNDQTTLDVEGKLVGLWVRELEQCWQTLISSDTTRSIRVNLSAVGYIDSAGKQLLTRMRKQGVVLVPTGCFMKAIVDEIENEASKE